MKMKTSLIDIAVSIGLFACLLFQVDSASTIISDDRVRNMDIAPVLGRGYSIQTDSYQSTCLNVDETTVPSYNYDFIFTDFTEATDTEVGGTDPNNPSSLMDLADGIKNSFGYYGVVSKFNLKRKRSGKTSTKTHMIVATMRVERYYSSVKEQKSPLVDDAKTLLEKDDYVGFFKACGPNYIRTIRRAQEVTAIFSFESSSTAIASEFASDFKVKGYDGTNRNVKLKSKSKYDAINSSLKIDIQAWGLGLDHEGSGSLVAKSVEDYDEIMEFAYKAMTQNDDYNIGMVYGIEVVSWIDNVSFQASSGLHEVTGVYVPKARSELVRAVNAGGVAYTSNDDITLFSCDAGQGLYIDRDGYCCPTASFYNPTTRAYDTTAPTPETRVCRVLKTIDKTAAKDTMLINAEFVSSLDLTVRNRLNQLTTLSRCITAVKSIAPRYDFHLLRPQASAEYDADVANSFTVHELKKTVDPLDNYSLAKHMGEEMEEFMNMFYTPCLNALYGSEVYDSDFGELEPAYFFVNEYHTHDACSHLSCLTEGMRWDRSSGGCVKSLVSGGGTAPDYSGGDDFCSKDSNGDCKYLTTNLSAFHTNVTTCWNNALPTSGTVDHYVEQFCMPQVTTFKVSAARQAILESYNTNHCTIT